MSQEVVHSQFGWPLHARQTYFKAETSPTGATYSMMFMGSRRDFPVIAVPIGLPKYRLLNGRTASSQQEFLAENPTKGLQYFEEDTERLDAQEDQHVLLQLELRAGGLLDKFEDPAMLQIEPLILDEHGYVLNGNRRLCLWRTLFYAAPDKYPQYSHVRVVVLPHADGKELDRLEAGWQVDPDVRADYSWDATANMMKKRKALHGLTDKELANFYKMDVSDVRQLFDMLEYAEEYLSSRQQASRWSLVADKEFAFQKLVQTRAKCRNESEKEILKHAAFALIDKPEEAGGRLYEAIPNIYKYLSKVEAALGSGLAITLEDQPSEFGEPSSQEAIGVLAVINNPDRAAAVRGIVTEVIEAEKTMERDTATAEYVVRQLAKVNAMLERVMRDGLRPDTTTVGVAEQIEEVERRLGIIREWVADAAH